MWSGQFQTMSDIVSDWPETKLGGGSEASQSAGWRHMACDKPVDRKTKQRPSDRFTWKTAIKTNLVCKYVTT